MVVLHPGDYGVINSPAALVGEDGEGAGPEAEAGNVGDDQALKEADAVLPLEAEAAHVGDVEEAAVGAAVEGGVHDGVLVLDGHAPAGEGHHLAIVLDVEIVEGGLLELGLGGRGGGEGARPAVGLGLGEVAGDGLPKLPEPQSPHLGGGDGDAEREIELVERRRAMRLFYWRGDGWRRIHGPRLRWDIPIVSEWRPSFSPLFPSIHPLEVVCSPTPADGGAVRRSEEEG